MNELTEYWHCDKCGELRNKLSCTACKTPPYNIESATLKKFRRNAKDGLATWSKWERHLYGAAVEQAVLAKQRSEFMRALPPMRAPYCASGSWVPTNRGAVGDEIRRQHRTSLLNCPAQVRRERTPEQWQKMYDEAMKEKRA